MVSIKTSELCTTLVLLNEVYVRVVIDVKTLGCLERRGMKENEVNMKIMED
jgi:hypothetical protein